MMFIKLLFAGSAIVYAILGGLLLFLPFELATAAGLDSASVVPLQLIAGGLLAMATLNWIGRNAIYGGIYGKPILLANFAFSMVTTGTLLSAVIDRVIPSSGWILVGVFAVFTIAFFRLLTAPPWKAKSAD